MRLNEWKKEREEEEWGAIERGSYGIYAIWMDMKMIALQYVIALRHFNEYILFLIDVVDFNSFLFDVDFVVGLSVFA